jgi:hypothetical protein
MSSTSTFVAILDFGPRFAPVAGFTALFAAFVVFFGSIAAAATEVLFFSSAWDLSLVTGLALVSMDLTTNFFLTLTDALEVATFFGLVAGMKTPQNNGKGLNLTLCLPARGRKTNWILVGQDLWANIWDAVLAVGWPDEKFTFWPVPEVLLSLLPD